MSTSSRLRVGMLCALMPLSPFGIAQDAVEEQAAQIKQGEQVKARKKAGYHTDDFRIRPSVSVGVKYDDNIFATDKDTVSDWIILLSPQLRVDSTWSRHSLNFKAGADVGRYWEYDAENYIDYWGNAEGRINLSDTTDLFGGIGFMLDPQAGLMAGGMAVLFVAIMLGLSRLVGGKSRKQESALVLEPDRIWIDRPQRDEWLSKLGRRILTAISGRQIEGGERPEETIARQAIEQIRVDTYTSHYSGTSSSSCHGGSTVHDRLVIEGDGGRIAYIGSQFDKRKLEWVRDYLRFQLAGG